jgi:lipoprotein-anchoring transpeptidase ErfK/SrfK
LSFRRNGNDQGGRRLALVALVVLALVSGACAQSGTEPEGSAASSQASGGNEEGTEQGTVVAEANGPAVEVFDAPDAPAPRLSLSNPTDNGGPRVFLVKERRPGWLNVALPVRPNGSTGWIREGDVTLSLTPYRISVDLAGHKITVWDGDEVILDEPVGVGKRDAPTPGGDYYLAELLQPPDPTTVYGPYAFGLSGFSDVFTNFAGGEGVIGIHGNDDPSTLGTDVSSGCIRMSNDGITRLAQLLPLGTPVTIV